MRIGIFGGTFSPVHNGHIAMLECFAREPYIDKILVVPTYLPPHKGEVDGATVADRVRMLELAVNKVPKAKISDVEIKRGNVSYTVDTLRELSTQGELYLLLGSDMFLSLESWREPLEIMKLAHIVVGRRENDFATGEKIKVYKADLEKRLGARIHEILFPPFVISSSEIRGRIAQGRSIDGLVPKDVADYIDKNGLYV